MRRRDVLAAVPPVAVAGCLGGPAADSGDSVSDTEFAVTAAGCGRVREAATVTVENGTATVTGTTSAPNGCYTAELAAAAVSAGELRVTVVAVEREGVQGCVQCVTELDYEATVAPERGLPARVVVRHQSRGETRAVAVVEP